MGEPAHEHRLHTEKQPHLEMTALSAGSMQERKIRFQLVSGNTETVVYHTLTHSERLHFMQ